MFNSLRVFLQAVARASSNIGTTTSVLVVLSTLSACTHLAIDDCGEIVGNDVPRIRSSHWRMELASIDAVANKVAPYAIMSALAYSAVDRCADGSEDVDSETDVICGQRQKFEQFLSDNQWHKVDISGIVPAKADHGFYAEVWENIGEERQVVIAFRGTEGLDYEDWMHGNLRVGEDQYDVTRAAVEKVYKHFDSAQSSLKTTYFATGHSLGGGLAQHALYSYPAKISQVFAFNPSPFTGFLCQPLTNKEQACDCSGVPAGEARVYRIYDSREVLALVRLFHKIGFPPERQVQEIRFPIQHKHAIGIIADYFMIKAKAYVPNNGLRLSDKNKPEEWLSLSDNLRPWFSGKNNHSSGLSCTKVYVADQQVSCLNKFSPGYIKPCPQ